CGATSLICATTMPLKAGAAGAVPSTSRPAMVRRCARASVSRSGLTKARSHDSGNSMIYSSNSMSKVLAIELAQEAQIALEELAQVVDAIAQHGQAFQPGAKRKTNIAFRVEAEVAHHLRVHLS